MTMRNLALQVACSTLISLVGLTLVHGGESAEEGRPRIGLVLSGGGARGGAHVGVLKVLEELRVPVDCIAGTSMGAIIASLYAKGLSPDTIRDTIHNFFLEIKPLNEYTLPFIALLRSKKLDHVNQMAFEEMTIEDLWLNFFCISSNLTTAQMMIHRNGPVWQATRASSSIPGLALPVISGNHFLRNNSNEAGGGIAVNTALRKSPATRSTSFP